MSDGITRDFDDIVVGAGGAGAVLAARLSEETGRRIGLIEAGPDYPTLAETPPDLLDGNVMSLVNHDWRFTASITADRTVRFPQGRVVGGSSAVGNTVGIRGMPADYEEWANAGNPEWSWNQVLPHFITLEDDLDFGDEPFHGRGGPIPLRRWRSDELTDAQEAFYNACLAAGYPDAEDHNHPASTGVGPIPSTRRDPAIRVSTATGYLGPARDRANLTVIGATTVSRVLVRDGSAVGVEVLTGTGTRELRSRRVILAAGAIGSPAILLRSGIGPADDLRALGIDVRADLPGVGAGLTDQPRIGVFMTPRPGAENTGSATGQIVLRTSAAGSALDNDMYYAMVNRFDLTHHFPALRAVAGARSVFGVMVVARRPHSRGRVRITSTDPHAAPEIALNYLADERDFTIMADGLRTCWNLAHSAKIRDLGEQVVLLSEDVLSSDEALRDYLRVGIDSAYNPVGTARMGNDPDAVVDQRCAVRGIGGLYVADASAMPAMVRANTLLTVLMMAERVAAMLKNE